MDLQEALAAIIDKQRDTVGLIKEVISRLKLQEEKIDSLEARLKTAEKKISYLEGVAP